MYWDGWGWMMLLGGLGMILFWGGIAALVVWLIMRSSRQRAGTSSGKTDPLDIARERYARGEITKEQFDQLKKDLMS